MTIDWTKPLELVDGTPVMIEPGSALDNGHYWIVREDGGLIAREYEQLWMGDAELYGVAVRNREPAAELACIEMPEQPTLRDRFAMAALTGILSCSVFASAGSARDAYSIADAMMAERQKGGSSNA